MRNFKKMLALVLVIAMAFFMVACTPETETTEIEPDVDTSETQSDASDSSDASEIASEDIDDTDTDSSAPAVEYPTGPITLICPWGAGGSTDITARAIAEVAEEKLGVPVVVENREGGSSTIGTQEVALQTEGDGTTILVATINALTILPHTLDLDYAPDNFKAIGQVSVRDMAIITSSSQTWETIDDFIADAKEHPGEYLLAVPQGGLQHLLFQQLCNEAGIEVTLYPISGDAEALTAILGGVADIAIPGSYSVAAGQFEAGEVKALAAFSDRPIEDLPDTPLLMDLGYDIAVYPWTCLLVPADTPDDLLAAMESAFEEILNDDGLKETLVKNGQIPYYLNSSSTMEMILKQYNDFGDVVASMDMDS